MNLSVTTSYAGTNLSSKMDDKPEFVVKSMIFEISGTCITDVEEVDEMIRQLQLIRQEIAGGCTKAVIQPITSSN